MSEAAAPDTARMAENANTMLGMITSYWVSQTLRAVCDLRITDHLADGGGDDVRRDRGTGGQ
jgi:hypothetical protein